MNTNKKYASGCLKKVNSPIFTAKFVFLEPIYSIAIICALHWVWFRGFPFKLVKVFPFWNLKINIFITEEALWELIMVYIFSIVSQSLLYIFADILTILQHISILQIFLFQVEMLLWRKESNQIEWFIVNSYSFLSNMKCTIFYPLYFARPIRAHWRQ